ncbi:hypothetical protein CPB84DRAFT_1959598 [Gymnopilus junonius]|uniref:Uncharacterized protein n=1 Tax=Gymnopilus junonius TaxID=109634 RepID=A0A9P5NWU6_GYMJU|nr:hypothetical protein CPB84DRAFT_1959598 [Gymnopilus junonius]
MTGLVCLLVPTNTFNGGSFPNSQILQANTIGLSDPKSMQRKTLDAIDGALATEHILCPQCKKPLEVSRLLYSRSWGSEDFRLYADLETLEASSFGGACHLCSLYFGKIQEQHKLIIGPVVVTLQISQSGGMTLLIQAGKMHSQKMGYLAIVPDTGVENNIPPSAKFTFLNQSIYENTWITKSLTSEASFSLTREWLRQCLQAHHNCAEAASTGWSKSSPSRLVDVGGDGPKIVVTQELSLTELNLATEAAPGGDVSQFSTKASFFGIQQQSEEAKHDAWTDIQTSYTRCFLTRFDDRLVAISAVTKQFEVLTGWQNMWGLWKEWLLIDMLWFVEELTKGRPDTNEYLAPTWSWAVVEGRVIKAIGSRAWRGSMAKAQVIDVGLLEGHGYIRLLAMMRKVKVTIEGKLNPGMETPAPKWEEVDWDPDVVLGTDSPGEVLWCLLVARLPKYLGGSEAFDIGLVVTLKDGEWGRVIVMHYGHKPNLLAASAVLLLSPQPLSMPLDLTAPTEHRAPTPPPPPEHATHSQGPIQGFLKRKPTKTDPKTPFHKHLENLSWRLWHLQNLMVDTDNAKSKREFKKLSKHMSDKLDKEKGQSIDELEAPDFRCNHSTDLIRHLHSASTSTVSQLPPRLKKPDTKPSTEFAKWTHAPAARSHVEQDTVMTDNNAGCG